jgi:Protein kinase domain/Kelch motif/Galactose oxidase, central domain
VTDDQPAAIRRDLSPYLPVGNQIGDYRIEGFVRRGGMALVYAARDLRLDRRVALKLLAPEFSQDENFRERFLRESRFAAALDHPNIVPIYSAGEVDGLLYIAMRFVRGSDLGLLLDEQGPLRPDRALAILDPIADALDTAHTAGLIHRDVKPGNILITAAAARETHEHAYLSDFGVTKRASSLGNLTATGEFIGTVAYIAPEQIRGDPLDARTDIYALGCVVHKCLTGAAPFVRHNDAALLWAHLHEQPVPLSHYDPSLVAADSVLAKVLAKAPGDRYESCQLLIEALADALSGRRRESIAEQATAVTGHAIAATQPLDLRVTRQQGPVGIPAASARVDDEPTVGRAGRRSGPGAVDRQPCEPATARIARARRVGRTTPARIWGTLALAGVLLAGVLLWHPWAGRNTSPAVRSTAAPVVTPSPPAYPTGWRRLSAVPIAVEGAGAASFGGQLWVIGGNSATAGHDPLASVQVFDPRSDGWRAGPSLPQPVGEASVVSTGKSLYVLGGLTRAQDGEVLDTVYRLDDPQGSWRRDAALPQARVSGAAAFDGLGLVYAGGIGSDQRNHAEVFALRDGAWRVVSQLPASRDNFAAASDGAGTVWFFGGNYMRTILRLRDRTITTAGQLSFGVRTPAAVFWPGAGACLIGGQGNAAGAVSCLARPASGWDPPNLSTPRGGLAAAVVGDRVYTVGGYFAGASASSVVEAIPVR